MSNKLQIMLEGGRKLGRILSRLLTSAVPGVSLQSLEDQAQRLIRKAGGTTSFTTVSGYSWATCLCVNDVVVHGVPDDYVLQNHDVLTIDIGMVYHTYHLDTAYTKIIVSDISSEPESLRTFLEAGESALREAIAQACAAKYVGDISQAIENRIRRAGYSPVRTLVGHGIGKTLHEPPQIPCVLRGSVHDTPKLTSGQTIAIEVIYTKGKPDVVYDGQDGWSVRTKDGSISAVFEHTVAITSTNPIVLTKRSK